jgi:hypothetical protein
MRKLAMLLLLTEIAFPAFAERPVTAAKPITVAHLEQTLAHAHADGDRDIARQLSYLALTERLSAYRFEQLAAVLKTERARQALLALADLSAFLDPPPAEIPTLDAPDTEAQHRIMTLARTYAGNTTYRMPNFTATKNTIRFEDTPKPEGPTGARYQPLHFSGKSSTTVFYLGGQEVAGSRRNNPDPKAARLDSLGEFGPFLSMVMADVSDNNLTWSHWEQGTVGPQAVFRYEVPRDKSHYEVNYCCVPAGDSQPLIPYHQISSYHGEIAVDPSTGTVLRLTVQTEQQHESPLAKTGTLVEYGPIEIDGQSYICPLKSVSLTRASIVPYSDGDPTGKTGRFHGPWQILLNHVAFENYRRFGTESRILTANDAADTPPK